MKSFICLTVLLILFSINFAHAKNRCLIRLTSNFERDGMAWHFSQSEFDVDPSTEELDEAAQTIVLQLLTKIGCLKRDIDLTQTPYGTAEVKCSKLSQRNDTSKVCYFEMNLGFFLISQDMVGNYHINFSRWD